MRRYLTQFAAVVLLASTQGCKHKASPAATSAATSQAAAPVALPVPAPPATPVPWMLSFQGKSMNELANDKRFPAFLRTHITNRSLVYWLDTKTKPSEDALNLLLGPGGDVHVMEHRYVTGDGCAPHDCIDKGLLWVDTKTGQTIFVGGFGMVPQAIAAVRTRLWLFSNLPLQGNALPPTFTDAIANWSSSNGEQDRVLVSDVILVQPDGVQSQLTPADVHAWQPPTPTPAGK